MIAAKHGQPGTRFTLRGEAPDARVSLRAAAARGAPAPAFTLTELLAVTVIIILLTSLLIGIASYAKQRASTSRGRADIAMIEQACEGFKADQGAYPTSTTWRSTSPAASYMPVRGYWEAINSALLYQQLAGPNSKGYLQVGLAEAKPLGVWEWNAPACTNGMAWVGMTQEVMTVFTDPWGYPYNYYCTYPRVTTKSNVVNYIWCNGGVWYQIAQLGVQANLSSFDLWSYGPNVLNDEGTNDDIANFRAGGQ